MSSRPKLSSGDRYFPQEDETRQEYANARIQDFQRFHLKKGYPVGYVFTDLLRLFRFHGEEYDRGARLRRDLTEGAA